MNRNGTRIPGPPPAADVPIIGESVWMACPRGHVQHLRRPFTIAISSGAPIPICGECWRNFVGMFMARPLEPEELAAMKAEIEAAAAEQGEQLPADLGGG